MAQPRRDHAPVGTLLVDQPLHDVRHESRHQDAYREVVGTVTLPLSAAPREQP